MRYFLLFAFLFMALIAWGAAARVLDDAFGIDAYLGWHGVENMQVRWGWLAALIVGFRLWQQGKLERALTRSERGASLVLNPAARPNDDSCWPADLLQSVGYVSLLLGTLAFADFIGHPTWLLLIAAGMLVWGLVMLVRWMGRG
jgi:hypothetical protein